MTSMHEYRRSRHSGAGNCECGRPERHRIHPHMFLHAAGMCGANPTNCTCGLPPEADCHMMTLVVTP